MICLKKECLGKQKDHREEKNKDTKEILDSDI